MPFNAVDRPHKLYLPLLAFCTLVDVVLHVCVWPCTTCGAEPRVLHFVMVQDE